MKLLKSPGPRKNARFRGGDLSPLADTSTDAARFFIGLCKPPREGVGRGRVVAEGLQAPLIPGRRKTRLRRFLRE